MFNVLVFHTESLKSQMIQNYLIYHCSSLSAVRTTSPISPTGTYKPTVRAPFWSSRVTTPVIPSGWATRRPPLCGTMTLYAPIGGVPKRPWKGPRSRPTCCRPPTGMNFSAGAEAAVGGGTCRSDGHGVKETEAKERKCSQTLFQSSLCHLADMLSVI